MVHYNCKNDSNNIVDTCSSWSSDDNLRLFCFCHREATEDVEERGAPDHIQEDPIVVAARELVGPHGALDGL